MADIGSTSSVPIAAHGFEAFFQKFVEMDWFLIFISFVGAVLLYLLSRNNGRPPFSLFKAINIKLDDSSPWYMVCLDIILISALGSIGVYFLSEPTTRSQAFVSGLGFVGLMSAVNKQ